MKLAQRIFEYLDKFSNRSLYTEGKEQPHFMGDLNSKIIYAPGDMKAYYHYSLLEDFLYGPKPQGDRVDINIIIDASHEDYKIDQNPLLDLKSL